MMPTIAYAYAESARFKEDAASWLRVLMPAVSASVHGRFAGGSEMDSSSSVFLAAGSLGGGVVGNGSHQVATEGK